MKWILERWKMSNSTKIPAKHSKLVWLLFFLCFSLQKLKYSFKLAILHKYKIQYKIFTIFTHKPHTKQKHIHYIFYALTWTCTRNCSNQTVFYLNYQRLLIDIIYIYIYIYNINCRIALIIKPPKRILAIRTHHNYRERNILPARR